MSIKINWEKIWEDFETWMVKKEEANKRCSSCHHKSYDHPEWEEQQDKIKRLVNIQVRELI